MATSSLSPCPGHPKQCRVRIRRSRRGGRPQSGEWRAFSSGKLWGGEVALEVAYATPVGRSDRPRRGLFRLFLRSKSLALVAEPHPHLTISQKCEEGATGEAAARARVAPREPGPGCMRSAGASPRMTDSL